MKKIKLTREKFALVDNENFEWLNQWKWFCDSSGYAARTDYCGGRNLRIYMHRVINGTPGKMETDHINLNKLDNRKANLRTATSSLNKINRPMQPNNSSGYKGVCWNTSLKLWVARVWKSGKIICKYERSLQLAVLARKELERKHYGK